MPITVLRRPMLRDEPTTVCTSVVSVVSRLSTSPVCVVSKNSGLCSHHVRVDGVAQVGGDALAQPADHVEARRREHAQRRAHAEQRQEVPAQRHHALAGVGGDQALVDQRLQRQREGQRAHRRQHQEQQRPARCGRGRAAGRAAGRTASAAIGPRRGRLLGHGQESMRRRRPQPLRPERSRRPSVRPEPTRPLWSNLGATLARASCAIIDPMFDPAAEPRWMRRCTALALRLGFLPSLAALSLLLVLGVLGLTQAAVLIIGQGPRPLALLVAGAMALAAVALSGGLAAAADVPAGRRAPASQRQCHQGRPDRRAQPPPFHAGGRARMGALPALCRRRRACC